MLIVFRVLQAIGASMLNPVAMSIITNTFTEPRERAQAVGVWGAVFGVAMALGPIVGGALVSTVGWRVDLPDQHPARARWRSRLSCASSPSPRLRFRGASIQSGRCS